MFVKTLVLEALRSFPSVNLEFSRGINLIVGHNNSGKSTIIKSLYLLQNPNSIASSDIRLTRDFAQISIGLDNISSKARNRYFSLKNPLADDCMECTVNYKIIKHITEKKYTQKFSSRDSIQRDFHDFPSAENEYNFIYPFLAKRKLTHYSIQGTNVNANSVLDNFQNLPLKVQKVFSQPKTKEDYERLCKDILGFTVTSVISDSVALGLGTYSGYSTTIPVESMGDGVVNVAGLLSILLTENDKLFLIEEPENDLHPAALKKLLQLIIDKSRNNQFIISTHSNIVLKHLGSAENARIFHTEWKSTNNDGDDIPTSIITPIGDTTQERLWVLENLGYEPFDYELFKGYLILEESTAERLIRDCIIPFYVPEARGVIRTIATQGVFGIEAKFDDLQKLFLYLHLAPVYENRAWVIADGDQSGRDIVSELAIKFKTWNPSHFIHWEKSNFEEYYPSEFQQRASEILSMPHSLEKQIEKGLLVASVIQWFKKDPAAAKPVLEESCSEIISKLKNILKAVNELPKRASR